MNVWRLVPGNCRCQDCGEMVRSTWRLFPKPGSWTIAWCVECTERRLAQQ